MNKYLVIFFVENKYIQYSLEEVLQNLRNGLIDRRLLNIRQELEFPICEKNGAFFLNNNDKILIQCNQSEIKNAVKLEHGDFITISDMDNPYQILWLEKRYLSWNMKKVMLPRYGSITIGRSEESHIILDINGSISRHHVCLHINGEEVSVEDLSGKAGVYLNGRKIIVSKLKCGDHITIMGITMVYMKNFLMVPDRVMVHQLQPMTSFSTVNFRKEERSFPFERTPRIYKSLITDPVIIDAPPKKQERKQLPFILAVGPSLTMALAMMTNLAVTISRVQETGSYTSIVSSGTMTICLLAGAVLWPFLSRRYYKKQDKIAEKYRKSRYQEYLRKKREQLKKEQEYNCWIWNTEYYPEIPELLDYISKKSRRLWEKSPSDQDFLDVRLGIGEKKSEIEVKTPEKHFSLYDDELLEQTYQLEDEYKKVTNVPIAISLKEKRVIGIVGDREKINKMIWCMVINLVSMHSPDEVKIGFIGDRSQILDFEWMTQLPHVWNEDGTNRFFATEPEEVHSLLMCLDAEERKLKDQVYHVLFVLNDRLMDNEQMGRCSYMLHCFKNVSMIYGAEFFSRIPKETEAIILNDSEQTGIYRKNEEDNQFVKFVPDEINYLQIQQMVHVMGKLKTEIRGTKSGIPERVSFLEMYHVGNVQMLDLRRRWKESRISKSMSVPIGIKEDGDVFCLDIHEKYHGCHGLVAGMTGSGKSEFLQEFILSLMVNYSPEDVAFILIDFKGGDMARPFLKSPHLSATISNLSGNMLYRARVSIEAEIQKRQILFNKTAQMLGVDKLDINSWHRYMDEGRIKKKLPHLVIIIDEFAQLKTQQPDFLDYLINVAQVGRSLGIHLILATQKPNGVVSPQIWSNSRFRVCLKVLDKEDSKEMIHRSDAAAIKLPGRAYVQVGYDEVFEQVQTGYSGADYIASKKYMQEGENSVEVLDYTGKIQREAKKRRIGYKNGKSQLEETVAEIIRVSNELNVHADQLWKPPLEKRIYLEECLGYTCEFHEDRWDLDQDGTAVCGLCDLPHKQDQKPFMIHLVQDGHMAIYGVAGTGKTVFLQTMVFSLALRYSPQMMQLFVIDCGGRTLGNLKELPHCVDVAYEEESNKIEAIITQVMKQMEKRKKLFAEKECNTYASYLNVTQEKLPMILLIIDNYSVFRDRMFQLEDVMIQLASNAKTYGIYLILTGNGRNAIYYKVAEHIGTKIVFQMGDRQHYKELLNSRVTIEPEDVKGRALVKYEECIVEMQVALPFDAVNEAKMYSEIKKNYKLMRLKTPQNLLKEKLEDVERNTISGFPDQGLRIQENSNEQIPVLPELQSEDQSYVIGNSLRNGSKQGFLRKELHRFFVGSESKVASKNLMRIFDQTQGVNCFLFSLNEKAKDGWNLLSTEQDISEFVLRCSSDTERKILIINDFSDFYDTISDDDLVTFSKYLKSAENESLTIITVGVFERLEDYRDTGLYVHLVRCLSGMVVGGKIDNARVAMLCNELSKSSFEKRSAELKENQAILYCDMYLSYIAMEEWS